MTTSRRGVLLGGLGLAGAAGLAACSGSGSRRPAPSSPPPPSPTSPYVGDARFAALFAALENLTAAGYGVVLTKIRAGTYGPLPGSVVSVVTTAAAHHADHAQAWNRVLTGSGRPAVTGTPLTTATGALAPVQAAAQAADALAAAGALEQTAAATYLAAVAALRGPQTLALAAAVAPVEAQHGAVLQLLLGAAPVPAATLSSSGGIGPDALTA